MEGLFNRLIFTFWKLIMIFHFLTLILFVVSWRNCVHFLVLIWKHWIESTTFSPFLVLNISTTLFLDISWFQNTSHLYTKQNSLMSEIRMGILSRCRWFGTELYIVVFYMTPFHQFYLTSLSLMRRWLKLMQIKTTIYNSVDRTTDIYDNIWRLQATSLRITNFLTLEPE